MWMNVATYCSDYWIINSSCLVLKNIKQELANCVNDNIVNNIAHAIAQ